MNCLKTVSFLIQLTKNIKLTNKTMKQNGAVKNVSHETFKT